MSALPMEGGLDLSAIFPGMDPETLRRLMAQFQPNDADKASARSDAFVDGGLALLANSRRGHEMEALGNAGLFGRGTYRSTLDNLTKQRGASISQAGAAYKLAKDMESEQRRMGMLTGGPPPSDAPAAPVSFPHGGTVTDALTGDAPGVGAATPAPAASPATAGPPNLTTNYYRKKAYAAGFGEAFDMAIASQGDWAGKAATVFEKMSTPHVVTPGGTLTGNDGRVIYQSPNIDKGFRATANGGAELIPGVAAGTEALATATERAKAGQNVIPVTITDANGKQTVQQMTQADAAAYLSGKRPGAPAAAKWTGTGNGPTDAEQALVTAQGGPDLRGAPSGLGTSDPVAMEGAKAQASKAAGTYGELFDTTQKAGMAANGKLNNLNRLESLMAGVDTGKLTPLGTEFAAWAQAAGMPIDPKLGNKQATESILNQMALEMRNPSGGAGMPGSMSDNDLKFLKSIPPSLSTTPEGRAFIIDTHKKLAERDKEVAKIVRTYQKDHGGQLDSGIYDVLQANSEANPLFTEKDVARIGNAGGAPELTDAAKGNGTAKTALAAALAEPDAAKRAAALETLRKRGAIK